MSPVSRRRKQPNRSGARRQSPQQRQAKAAYLNVKRETEPGRYWHGGRAGLEPGTILIPRAVAEREGADLRHYEAQPGYDLGVTDAERVYFASSREFARGFAAQIQMVEPESGVVASQGALYEVEPIGEIEKDPDFEGSVSWCAPRARIVAVAEPDVRLHAYEITARLGPHITWLDGSPIYTREGHYIPSPEQLDGGLHPMFAVLHPWTPVEFVNAWIAGKPSGNRAHPDEHPGVLVGAVEAGQVLMQHFSRATALMERGVEFATASHAHLASVNELLDGRTHVRHDDTRGIVVALDPSDGVIGAMVFTGAVSGPKTTMLIDAIVVSPAWRRRGLGAVLLRTGQKIMPALPSFAAGHCAPDVAPFFAQVGFTVLRPGVPLLVTIGDEQRVFPGMADECWFYRQGPV